MYFTNYNKIGRWVVLCICLVICLLGTVYLANDAKPVFYPNGFHPTAADWNDGSAEFELGSNGKIYYHGCRDSPISAPGTCDESPCILTIKHDRPLHRDSSLFLYLRKTTRNPPEITVISDGTPVAKIIHNSEDDFNKPYYAEVLIPKPVNDKGEFILQLNSEGGSWLGGLLLIPNAGLRRFLAFAMLPAFMLGLGLACYLLYEKKQILMPVVGVFAFLFYYYWNFQAKILPCGSFFSDSKELVDFIRFNEWSFDMQKHVLFLPVFRTLTTIASFFTSKPLRMISIAFSLIAVANVSLGIACIQRVELKRLSSTLLSIIYACSFAIVTYSSIYETYIFSTLIVNACILASLMLYKSSSSRNSIFAAVSCGLLPLATWQLLAFVPFFLTWNISTLHNKSGSKLRQAMRQIFITFMAFGLSYAAIQGIYQGPFSTHGQTTTKTLANINNAYASIENMTGITFAQVLNDTFVTSLVNTDIFVSTLGENYKIGIHIIKLAVICFLLILLSGSAVYICKQKLYFNLAYITFALGLLSYVGFHWYFNPTEMFLYTAPIVLVWILPASYALRLFKKGHLLTSCLVVLLMLQMVSLCACSVQSISGLFNTKDEVPTINTIGWSVR